MKNTLYTFVRTAYNKEHLSEYQPPTKNIQEKNKELLRENNKEDSREYIDNITTKNIEENKNKEH